jgi:hypothetical protein
MIGGFGQASQPTAPRRKCAEQHHGHPHGQRQSAARFAAIVEQRGAFQGILGRAGGAQQTQYAQGVALVAGGEASNRARAAGASTAAAAARSVEETRGNRRRRNCPAR